jgi:hypothetical protein
MKMGDEMAVSDRLAHAKARLEAYYEAELAVLSGQAYKIGTRSMTRADLGEIRQAIGELERLVEELQAQADGKGPRKAFRIIPRDL